jgi:predicted nucleic acid-binding protein
VNVLLDTNIWLERLLDQERAAEVADLLARVPTDQLYLTDFSLHSIGVILCRLKQSHVFMQFVQDLLVDGAVHLITILPFELVDLADAIEKFGLDFDDAYQYIAAKHHDLTLVSLDKDFNRTDLEWRTPGEFVQALSVELDSEE